jgi:hypothetical protein
MLGRGYENERREASKAQLVQEHGDGRAREEHCKVVNSKWIRDVERIPGFSHWGRSAQISKAFVNPADRGINCWNPRHVIGEGTASGGSYQRPYMFSSSRILMRCVGSMLKCQEKHAVYKGYTHRHNPTWQRQLPTMCTAVLVWMSLQTDVGCKEVLPRGSHVLGRFQNNAQAPVPFGSDGPKRFPPRSRTNEGWSSGEHWVLGEAKDDAYERKGESDSWLVNSEEQLARSSYAPDSARSCSSPRKNVCCTPCSTPSGSEAALGGAYRLHI